jgi:hypothetical protein
MRPGPSTVRPSRSATASTLSATRCWCSERVRDGSPRCCGFGAVSRTTRAPSRVTLEAGGGAGWPRRRLLCTGGRR